ncbi:MAG: hypothetical protein BroJett011_37400 [Chloroflexota bacterium]|nr:MAG: hypothetical protein BroJett011_37400 [Chloroflexota bacterium]
MMLKQILAEFEQKPTTLCLDELSQKLAITPSALEGMLDTLVRKGRLLEVSATHNACHTCPARAGCVIISSSAKSYLLAPPRSPLS